MLQQGGKEGKRNGIMQNHFSFVKKMSYKGRQKRIVGGKTFFWKLEGK
jgi:hypothetical protein